MKIMQTHRSLKLLAACLMAMPRFAMAGAPELPKAIGSTAAPTLSKLGADILAVPDIAAAKAALNATFAAPLQLKVEAQKTQPATEREVNDCQALLALNGQITDTVSVADRGFLLRQQASCEALNALTAVRPASASLLPSLPWPQAWKALTNTALWPADVLPQMGDEPAHALSKKAMPSLQQAHRGKPWRLDIGKHTPEGTFVLKGSALTVQLQALARGDFNGDGQQDWLVLWSAHANGGSWEGVRAAVLSRPIGQKMITLTWLPLAP